MSDIEDPIIIANYDANWSNQYKQEKIRILNALGDTIADIQHIGSTSVPGLAAKPVIDILLGLKQTPPSPTQMANLQALDYLYCGELGIPNRYYFRRGMPRTYQIHAVRVDSEFWRSHILFRDFLIAHPAAVKQYEVLKRKLAVEFQSDRHRYTNNKAPLIQQLLAQAKIWRTELKPEN